MILFERTTGSQIQSLYLLRCIMEQFLREFFFVLYTRFFLCNNLRGSWSYFFDKGNTRIQFTCTLSISTRWMLALFGTYDSYRIFIWELISTMTQDVFCPFMKFSASAVLCMNFRGWYLDIFYWRFSDQPDVLNVQHFSGPYIRDLASCEHPNCCKLNKNIT